MIRYLLLIVVSISSCMTSIAQEYKVKRSTGRLVLSLPGVLIEGYNGNEIVFSSLSTKPAEVDPKAEGLQTINSVGFRDNSGLGISVVEKGNLVIVDDVLPDLDIKILVPKGMIVSFECNKMTKDAKVICRNMDNEIEIQSYDNNIILENVTGPIAVRTLYGSIEAIFKAPVKGPVLMASVQSTVDVTIPVETKANLTLKSIHSTIMASPDLKIDVQAREDKDVEPYSNQVYGKLNGGGEDMVLISQYGKIYLRKTK
jgi:hypothetical protein